MRVTDIKVLMMFSAVDTAGVLFVVDEIYGEEASGRLTKCGKALGSDVVRLKDLVDETRWKFIGTDPIGEALLKKRRWALRPLMVFHEVSDLAGPPDVVIDELYADAEGPHTAVCRAVSVAHPTETPFEVKVTDLLDEKKYVFQPELTFGTMHEKIRYLQEYVQGLKQPPGKLPPERLGFGQYTPHAYVETNPYNGCGDCGVGPGALHHNSHEVKHFNEKCSPDDARASSRPIQRLNAENELKHWQTKAVVEKARRIQLMGRVDELKAALGDAKQGFELELPGQWPERFNVLLELEPQDPKDWTPRYDYKARWPAVSGRIAAGTLPEGNLQVLYRDTLFGPRTLALTVIDLEGNRSTVATAHGADLTGVNAFEVSRSDLCTVPCAWCDALADRCRSRGGCVLEPDPFKELSAVLWFLASLTSDHEPGCIVKDGKGEPCDCDVTLREGEPWWRRVRASLSLPAALKGRLEKAETQLKARRVVQVKPVAGVPGPNGDGTVYEFKMPEGDIKRLMVVRYEPNNLDPEQMRAISEGLRKKLPGVLVLFAQPNWELTLLELPK
jgi:hypothetical protein